VFALAEMPMMVLALRTMRRGKTLPLLAALTNVAYVMFAAVYAGIFLLLTGDETLGLVMASLSVVRFGSGVFVRW
jgi:hypothetical protein